MFYFGSMQAKVAQPCSPPQSPGSEGSSATFQNSRSFCPAGRRGLSFSFWSRLHLRGWESLAAPSDVLCSPLCAPALPACLPASSSVVISFPLPLSLAGALCWLLGQALLRLPPPACTRQGGWRGAGWRAGSACSAWGGQTQENRREKGDHLPPSPQGCPGHWGGKLRQLLPSTVWKSSPGGQAKGEALRSPLWKWPGTG